MAKSTYFYQLSRGRRPDKHGKKREAIKEKFEKCKKRVGYRTIAKLLKADGMRINKKLVKKLMDECGLHCRVRVKKYKSYKGEVGKVAGNILQRDFEASKPCEKWVTDITQFNVAGTRLYLSPIMDLYNREIVSYSIGESPGMDLIREMLAKSERRIVREGLVLHSDQGWQYQQKSFQRFLTAHGMTQSMSRKGNCYDNAVIENFFGTLKCETIYIEKIETIEGLKKAIEEYIEYYNKRRIQGRLKGLSPIDFGKQSLCQNALF